MAENKKSFLAYADWLQIFDQLKDNEAGKLIKTILQYVNDQSPQPTDRLIKIAFEPIKQQLKRDLQKWEGKLHQTAEAGINSAFNKFKNKILSNLEKVDLDFEKGYCLKKLNESNGEDIYFKRCYDFLTEINEKSTKSTTVETVATKSSVTVTVNDNDNDNDNVIKREEIPRAPDLSKSNLFRQPKIPEEGEVRRVFLQQGGTDEMAKKFFEVNEATGWFYKGSPITNFASQVPGYIRTWNENNQKNGSSKNGNHNNHGQSAGAIKLIHQAKSEWDRLNSI